MMVLEQAEKLSSDLEVRFAALVHDLGKGTTPKRYWPAHIGHEQRGVGLIRELAQRLPVPNACRDLGALVAEFHTHCHRAHELRPKTILSVLEKTDAFRRPDRFEQFLLTCEADARGRAGLEDRDYEQPALLRGALAAARDVDTAPIAAENAGARIPRAIRRARLRAIKAFRAAYQSPP
jgi:tRNA nucleotidyltransferase (CCA-adding enzyme)